MPSREQLLAEAALAEARLAELAVEVEATSARLTALREQLASAPVPVAQPMFVVEIAVTPMNNADKVALFRSLFRGRGDVFPRRWENAAKAKSGYSPTRDNEWDLGLCQKRKGAGRRATCGECPNQAFVAVSDEQVAKHL